MADQAGAYEACDPSRALRRERRKAPRLPGIEALRGLAACAVVLCHAARHVDKARGAPGLIQWVQAGHAGVDLFFVISGFVILTVHGGDAGRPSRLAHYLGRRLTRVFPPYWMALGLTIAISAEGGHATPRLVRVLWSALLLPSFEDPVLGIAWTLQFEMVFYALFAVRIVSKWAGSAVLALWLAASVAAGLGARPVWPPALGSIYAVEFFFGMVAALALTRREVRVPRLLAAAGAGCFLFGMVLESTGRLDGLGVAGRLAYGPAAMVLVLGVAAVERTGALHVPGWLRKLGNASYSIYLFQFLFIGLVWQTLLTTGQASLPSNFLLFAILAGTAVAGGLAAAALVERPLLTLFRRRLGASGAGGEART